MADKDWEACGNSATPAVRLMKQPRIETDRLLETSSPCGLGGRRGGHSIASVSWGDGGQFIHVMLHFHFLPPQRSILHGASGRNLQHLSTNKDTATPVIVTTPEAMLPHLLLVG